jgi:hypothetical protein
MSCRPTASSAVSGVRNPAQNAAHSGITLKKYQLGRAVCGPATLTTEQIAVEILRRSRATPGQPGENFEYIVPTVRGSRIAVYRLKLRAGIELSISTVASAQATGRGIADGMRSKLEDSAPECDRHCVRAIIGAQLGEDAVDVRLDRGLGDTKGDGDLLVRLSGSHMAEDGDFPLRQ